MNTPGKKWLCTKIMNFLLLCFIRRQAKRFDKNKNIEILEKYRIYSMEQHEPQA
jgi:hypothetical protein